MNKQNKQNHAMEKKAPNVGIMFFFYIYIQFIVDNLHMTQNTANKCLILKLQS